MNNENLKPFDLEKAKAGAKVVTRDGRDIRIICFDRKGKAPILGLIEILLDESILSFSSDGKYFIGEEESHYDLFMAPVRKKGWINVYPDCQVTMSSSKEEADGRANKYRLDCIEIEYNAE